MTAYWSAVGALSVAYFVLGNDVVAQHVIYEIFGVAGVAAVAVGVHRYRPSGHAWTLVLAGLALWVGGDTYWNLHRLVLSTEAPFPSPADGLYLAAYLPLIAAIILAARHGRPRTGDVVDAGIVGLAVGLGVWVIAILPAVRAHQSSLLASVIADTYPTMDCILAIALAQLLFTRARTAALNLLAGAFTLVLATDAVYTWLRAHDAFTVTSPVNVGYFWFYMLLGAASLSPTMTSLTPPQASDDRRRDFGRLSNSRLALLAAAVLASPISMIINGQDYDAIDIRVTGAVTGLLSILVLVRLAILFVDRDVIDRRRRETESRLQTIAFQDPLTGLANRPALFAAINDTIHVCGAHRRFALLFIDLDGFKAVNDSNGHLEGDRVLREAAHRLSAAVRPHDIVARHGGDEFIILLRHLTPDSTHLDAVTNRIAAAVAATPSTPPVSASIGIAIYPADGTTPDELIRAADQQMYKSKAAGRASRAA